MKNNPLKNNPSGKGKQPPNKKVNFYWIYALMAILFFGMYFYGGESANQKKYFGNVLKMTCLQSTMSKKLLL